MPSPESPAKRMMTRSSCWTCLVTEQDLLDAQHRARGRLPRPRHYVCLPPWYVPDHICIPVFRALWELVMHVASCSVPCDIPRTRNPRPVTQDVSPSAEVHLAGLLSRRT